MVFQGGALFDSMTVLENVSLGLREHTQLDRAEIDRRARRALEMVGLDGASAKMPAELSGGMKKRASLARAIVTQPDYLLYDEQKHDKLLGELEKFKKNLYPYA